MQRNRNVLLCTYLMAVTLGIGFAQAQDGPEGARQMDFGRIDVDGDGQIDRSDLDALRAARFAEVDANGDGSVSETEFLAHAEALARERAAGMFARLDADGDGALSRDVLEAHDRGRMGERLLRRADRDGSGSISREEFEAARARLAQRHGAHSPRRQ